MEITGTVTYSVKVTMRVPSDRSSDQIRQEFIKLSEEALQTEGAVPILSDVKVENMADA